MIRYLSNEKTVAFANHDNLFLVAEENKLNACDIYTGKPVFSYNSAPANSKITDIFYSKNDRYIVITDDKENVYIWKTDDSRLRKRFYGSSVRFSEDFKNATVGRKSYSNYTTYHYALPSFRRIQKYTTYKMLKELTSDLRKQGKKESGQEKITLPVKIYLNNTLLSPNGRYLLVPVYGAKGEQIIMFIDNLLAKNVYELRIKQQSNMEQPYHWLNDSLVFIRISEYERQLYNINSRSLVDDFNYKIKDPLIDLKNQISKTNLSPDYAFVIHQQNPLLHTGFLIKAAARNQAPSAVKSARFIDFTPNSRYLITQNKNKQFGYLGDKEIAEARGNDLLFPHLFSDTIKRIVENIIGKDGVIPQNYNFPRFSRMRTFEELEDTAIIYLKTVVQTDTSAEIQFHITDTRGVYYFGAGEKKLKNIWCNLLIKKPNGEVIQVKDFEVTEYHETDSLPIALSLVLDHSGSMGEERALTLQQGAISLINAKATEDAISVIKYDDRIKIVSPLSLDKEKILRSMEMSGLYGFGGGTALLDGLAAGIGTLKDARGFNEKTLILFTDGNENSSFSDKRDVILWAMENQVKINTIGFGESISEDYLKSISDHTGGSYYQIFQSSDLEWILSDMYRKVKNYYSIKINMEIKGDYIVYLKVCPPKAVPDTLMVKFNYQPKQIEKIRQNRDYNFKTLITEDIQEEIKVEEFKLPEIKDFKEVKIVETVKKETEEYFFEAEDKSLVEQEFDSLIFPDIKFVFDQTEIIKGTDKELINVINFMNKHKEIVIEIAGHTDTKGTEEYNIKLSQSRAEKVKELMVKRGIKSDRILTVGYGESKPIDENVSDRGRQKNRRVEFRIVDGY